MIELETLTVETITVPDSEATSVPHGATVSDVQAAALRSGHLRVLLTDSSGATPGVVHVRDTLLADVGEPAADYAWEAYTVDGSTPVYELLRQMRNRSVQLAVVETGGRFLGIVTLTDVIKRVLPTAPAA